MAVRGGKSEAMERVFTHRVARVVILAIGFAFLAVPAEASSSFTGGSESWVYDTTTAMLLAFVWLLAEWCSMRSQKLLQRSSFFNILWSLLTMFLASIAVVVFVLEQVLRERFQLSLPTTVATVVAAALSYVLVTDRFELFDKKAKIVQKVLCSTKLRFGRPGSLQSEKFLIIWKWWRRGVASDSWKEVSLSAWKGHQVLLDWNVHHRLGEYTQAMAAADIRAGEDAFWALVGALLYAWLPTGAHAHLHPQEYWGARGRLKGSYRGARGRRIGCTPETVPFEEWLAEPCMQQFQLMSLEYREATVKLIDHLSPLALAATSSQDAAQRFMTLWANLVKACQTK